MKLRKPPKTGAKVLIFDIETAPMLGYVWSLWQNDVALNQLHSDWYVLAVAAKWLGNPNVMYWDQREAKPIEDDTELLRNIHTLLDQADIVVTQNGKRFDVPRLNARFILQGLPPTSPFRHIDTKQLAKSKFAFTSNRLEYLTDKLCTTYKKLTKRKFQGFELWKECLAGNTAAWAEMQEYNKHDVLSLEELYTKLAPWGIGVNMAVYEDGLVTRCSCGSTEFQKNGFQFSNFGKYQRYRCKACGANQCDRTNAFSKEKRKSLKRVI